jgi:hypothetical protein
MGKPTFSADVAATLSLDVQVVGHRAAREALRRHDLEVDLLADVREEGAALAIATGATTTWISSTRSRANKPWARRVLFWIRMSPPGACFSAPTTRPRSHARGGNCSRSLRVAWSRKQSLGRHRASARWPRRGRGRFGIVLYLRPVLVEALVVDATDENASTSRRRSAKILWPSGLGAPRRSQSGVSRILRKLSSNSVCRTAQRR